MSGYAFSSQDVATYLRDLARSGMAGAGGSQAPLGRELITVKTPAEGLPPIVGDKTTIVECERAFLDVPYKEAADTRANIEATEYEKAKVPVLNLSSSEVSGGTFIQASRVGMHWIAVTGGGAGTPSYLCRSPVGGLAARSTTNGQEFASQTECDLYQINSNSGEILATGSTLMIFNIWSQPVEPNTYFTVQQIDGLFVPDAEDCSGT